MQIAAPQAVSQPPPTVAPQAAPVAERAQPVEPARRVTANREGAKGDLEAQPQHGRPRAPKPRGSLLDLLV
jgi:hypothetical protein